MIVRSARSPSIAPQFLLVTGMTSIPLPIVAASATGPALHNHLLFGIELDRVPPLTVQIPKEAFLPTREGEAGYGRCHAHIDPNIAYLSFVAELAGRCPAAW